MKRFLLNIPFRWSIASVLTLGMVSIITLVMALTTVLDIRRQRAIFQDELEQRGLLMSNTLTNIMADALYYSDVDKLRDLAEVVRSLENVTHVTVFGADGRLLAVRSRVDDQEDYPIGFVNDEFFLNAVRTGQPTTRFTADTFEVTSPIIVGREVIGGVQLIFDLHAVEANIEALTRQRIWQTVALVAVALVLSYLMAQYFIRPLRWLVEATKKIAEGDFGFWVDNGRKDEIGELTDAFILMARRLEERTTELRTTNAQLLRESAELRTTQHQLV